MNVICCCLNDLLVKPRIHLLRSNPLKLRLSQVAGLSSSGSLKFKPSQAQTLFSKMEANTLNLYDDDYLSVEDMMAENEDDQEIQDA
ncbi:hypothetical protein DY000_02043240 [Brassica cretica]|uniref:Uncharacterized protein n=1 Tax=Brassica cretica TaxID=69181 RepID=A0ABQ7BIB0_BRACR|nr:hypothetical protein DY000_02043240 [Brassica cretica]